MVSDNPRSLKVVTEQRSLAVLGALLEAAGELLERGLQVRHRSPDQREHRAGVLLAHREPCRATLRRERERPHAAEQAEWHAAAPDHPLARRELVTMTVYRL